MISFLKDYHQDLLKYLYPLTVIEEHYPIYDEYEHTIEDRNKWFYILAYSKIQYSKDSNDSERLIRDSYSTFSRIIPLIPVYNLILLD